MDSSRVPRKINLHAVAAAAVATEPGIPTTSLCREASQVSLVTLRPAGAAASRILHLPESMLHSHPTIHTPIPSTYWPVKEESSTWSHWLSISSEIAGLQANFGRHDWRIIRYVIRLVTAVIIITTESAGVSWSSVIHCGCSREYTQVQAVL